MIKELLPNLFSDNRNEGSWLGSKPMPSHRDNPVASYNPSNGELLGHVDTITDAGFKDLMQGASQAFMEWRKVPAPQRGEVVRQVGNALRQHKEELGQLVSLEMGKSLQEGLGEVQEMIDMADFAVGQSRMLYGHTMHSERPEHRMYEQWHPLGIVGVISAFNFPVAVWAWNAFVAAVCGNITVWKPSSKTPLCAVATQRICSQVVTEMGMPDIFASFVTQDRELSNQFLDDDAVPLVSFTGSTATGKWVSQRVAGRLGRTILELGGNNAMIVDDSANLDLVLPALVFGAVGTAGQRCTSTRRAFIHESIYDEVVPKLKSVYEQLRVGDPLDQNNHMGPLVDEAAVATYLKAVETIQSAGGHILTGGEALDKAGFYVKPTLVEGMSLEHAIVQEETFAPILYLFKFKELKDAIQGQNAVRQGLSSAIFTNQVLHAEQFLAATGSDCGIANVNIGTSGAEIGGAFGGEKDTGGGREAGSDSWKAYMRRQTNTINWGHGLPLAQGIKFNI